MQEENSYRVDKVLELVYLQNGIVPLIMPLGAWLGGVRDYPLTGAFIALAFFWTLAFWRRHVAASSVPVYGVVCSMTISVILSILYYQNFLYLQGQMGWILVYSIYSIYGLINSLYYPLRHRFGYTGGRWLGWVHIVAVFLTAYTITVIFCSLFTPTRHTNVTLGLLLASAQVSISAGTTISTGTCAGTWQESTPPARMSRLPTPLARV